MEDVSLLIHGLMEDDFHIFSQVQITDHMPTLEHTLLNTLNIEEHPDFKDIEYPTLDCDCCDLLIGVGNVELLLPRTGEEFHRVSGSFHTTSTRVGWIIARNHVMEETYPLTILMLPAEDNTEDFEETPNDDEAALLKEDRRTIEVVECTIKRVDNFKFQIAVPLRHISLILPDSVLIARERLNQQSKSLQNKPERTTKYRKKIMRLKSYIEKVDPEETTTTGNV